MRLVFEYKSSRLLWLRLFGFEFWMVAFVPFFIGFVVSSKKLYDFDLFYGFLIMALLTSSTFVLNHICDLDIDLKNPRKEFSLLVRGVLSVRQGWYLFWIFQVSCLLLSLKYSSEFIYCILGLTIISLIYNLEPFRLKTKPGLDIACNGLSLGFLVPLAAWSINQSLLDFPRLYFFAILCYLMALYCPTMAVDTDFDRKSGVNTFATKFGSVPTMRLSWLFTIIGASTLIYCGLLEIFPWNSKLLLWTGWLLVAEIIIHYVYLPINSKPSYDIIAKGSIILAMVEAVATLFFFLIFLDLLPIG